MPETKDAVTVPVMEVGIVTVALELVMVVGARDAELTVIVVGAEDTKLEATEVSVSERLSTTAAWPGFTVST